MKAARSGPATAAGPAGGEAPSSSVVESSPQGGVKSASGSAPSRGRAATGAEQLLQQAESQLAAAMAPDFDRLKGPPPELGPPQDFNFQDFDDRTLENRTPAFPIAALQDVELDLRI